MIKVTVVIPVYNVEAYLPACLDSVLGHSLEEIEIICIDDASPDRCGAILDEYAEKDKRVKVIHLPENHKQGYGRNRGEEAARGKYIYFLDSDDMITGTALEEMYEIAEADKLDGIIFDSQVLYESEELRKKHHLAYPPKRSGHYEDAVMTGSDLLDAFVAQKEWNVYVQRQFWRREYLQENDIYSTEGIEHEDEIFSFKAMLLAERMRYVPKDWFIRRYREGSVMTRGYTDDDFHGYFICFREMIDFAEKYGKKSDGALENIYHMYERMLALYPQFSAQEDPLSWFRTEEEKRAYRFFAYEQDLNDHYRSSINKMNRLVPLDTKIWIYGAGAIGVRVCRRFLRDGNQVRGFLVTNISGNSEKLFGLPVIEQAQADIGEDELVIVAVNNKLKPEICSLLEKRGVKFAEYPTWR